MLIDTHCHLDFTQFDSDRDETIKRAQSNKVSHIINVGTSIASSLSSKELSEKYDCIFFSVGLHPHSADEFNKDQIGELDDLTKSKKLVAIGEVGLDYYKSRCDRHKQREVFIEFIALARRLDLPLIVHSRQSQADTYSILKDELKDFKKTVFHCFSGPDDFLDKCVRDGAMFSFTANITFPKATKLRELARRVPLDRIMIETDSPFLAAQKFRGQRNEPSYVYLVAQELALIKGSSLEEIAEITTKNAINFFALN